MSSDSNPYTHGRQRSTQVDCGGERSTPVVRTRNRPTWDECRARPGEFRDNPFLGRAAALLEEGEYVTHRFDCNTVGPVPVASVCGSRTLTHSVVHVLDSSKDHASSPRCEASPSVDDRLDLFITPSFVY